MILGLLIVVPAALFFLGDRAVITRFIWSRYPAWLASLRRCAACSGFWDMLIFSVFLRYGLGVALPILPNSTWCPLLLALCSIITTPLLAAAHERAMHQLAYGETLPRAVVVEQRDGTA